MSKIAEQILDIIEELKTDPNINLSERLFGKEPDLINEDTIKELMREWAEEGEITENEIKIIVRFLNDYLQRKSFKKGMR